MPPQTMRQFLKPPEKAPDTLPRTQSTMSLLDYFSTVIQGLADPTGWTEPKAEDFDNPHAYTQALKAHGVGQLLGMAAPLAAPLAVVTRGARTAEVAAEAPQTLKAFHGSPHDFGEVGERAFRKEAIGSGEGGQAYSWYGHYFAQNPEVSQTYKKATGDALTIRLPGQKPLTGDAIDDIGLDAAKFLEMGAKDAGQFPHNKAYYAKKASDRAAAGLPGAAKRNDAVKARIDEWANAKIAYEPQGGHMYEVNLHTSPESLLDWDKPLSQQHPAVQEKLAKIGIKERTPDEQWMRKYELAKLYYEKPFHHLTAIEKQEVLRAVEYDKAVTGEQIYQKLVREAGGRAGHTEGIASQQLADAGIHGVQYLDQGSRTGSDAYEATQRLIEKAKAGGFTERAATLQAKLDTMTPNTRNYVIFPHFEHLIEISKKYGISLPAAASLYKWQQSQKGVE